MKRCNYIGIVLFCIVLLLPSCKKVGGEFAKKVTRESAEKVSKEVATETYEKTLKTLTKKELRSLDWSEIIKLIRKENINLADALNRLDRSFQKKIGKAIKSDYDFYSALVSSNSFVDEFVVFTKNAPTAADNVNIFKYFVKCRDLERRFGVNNALGDIVIKEETGIVKFFSKADNSLIGEMRDGIFLLNEPFKAGSNLLDNSSVLKKTLIPNSIYKIKGVNGLTFLYHVDDLGRFSKIEANGISSNELISNVIFSKENFNLGSEWTAKLRRVSQTSKGNDIDATFVFKYADDGTTPLVVKADVAVKDEKIISQSFENINELVKKANKSKPKVIKSMEGETAIKALSKSKNKSILKVVEKLEKNSPIIFSKKNLMVEELADGSLEIFYKGSVPGSSTKINIKGNKIKAKGGSLVGENSAQNQFLNNILPNMIYEIDDFVTYKTDNLGRVVEVVAERTKLDRAKIVRAGRDSDTQAAIRKNFPGHDGGHLVDCASGGANEMINQVPMETEFNRRGAWRKLELKETKAVKEDKNIKVSRKLIYADDSTRPIKIISEIDIDGNKTLIELDNPIPVRVTN